MTGKNQLTGSDFYQFHMDFQCHEVGLDLGIGVGEGLVRMELGTKCRCLTVGFCPSLG